MFVCSKSIYYTLSAPLKVGGSECRSISFSKRRFDIPERPNYEPIKRGKVSPILNVKDDKNSVNVIQGTFTYQ